ncbi:hypothetical protein MNBD_ALPHA07-604 [hydrothermal vent metagenome]|uniref:Uncharacterized protein n=1 Tax=hydrothermal vent metagenome TaxID=652676 RepID=A0A3B0RF19_9ZZZZ
MQSLASYSPQNVTCTRINPPLHRLNAKRFNLCKGGFSLFGILFYQVHPYLPKIVECSHGRVFRE